MELGDYFPNSLSEPALRRCSIVSSQGNLYCDKLDESMDRETFRLLMETCQDVELVSFSNLIARNHLIDLLRKAKIVVVDNATVDYLNDVHFEYSFFTDDNVPFGNYSSDYADAFPSSSEIFYSLCKNIRLPNMTPPEFNELVRETRTNKNNESVELNIFPTDIFEDYRARERNFESDLKQAMNNICEYMRQSPKLKRLTLGLGFLLNIHTVSMTYRYDGSKIEDLYIRKISNGCSKFNLDKFISGFTNVKLLVLENVKSKDCHLIKDALFDMKDLSSFRISFYDHQGYESKYFAFISNILKHHKNLTKFEIEFPYMEEINDESALLSALCESHKCRILLKRLPSISDETFNLLKKIPFLEFKLIPNLRGLNDHFLPEIDYEQDINTILNQRALFKKSLQKTEIVCPSCLKVIKRHSVNEHTLKCHSNPDINPIKKTIHSVTCPCCKEECSKFNDLDEHLNSCKKRELKIKLEDISDRKPLNPVFMEYVQRRL